MNKRKLRADRQRKFSSGTVGDKMTNAQGNRGWAIALVVAILMMLAAATAAPAQTFTTLVNLDSTDGAEPEAAWVQATDGNLYGTTASGGPNNHGVGGTVFKLTPNGTLKTLYDFCAQTNCADGAFPGAGLVLGADQNLYGVTTYGGGTTQCNLGCGTVFKITPGGILTTLHTFEGADGETPSGPLVQGADGNFYGTTQYGGVATRCTSVTDGCGTIFRITPAGVLTTLHSFNGSSDGYFPMGSLVQAPDLNFYGVTVQGGSGTSCLGTCGTVFKITPGGSLTTLHSFDYTDGGLPSAGLVMGGDGNFYGTAIYGGTSTACSLGCGTVFGMTRTGTVTTLHSFDLSDGAYPNSSLIQGTDGNFYGATSAGGSSAACPGSQGDGGCGTLFRMTPAGALTTLHNFNFTDGWGADGLFQSTNGVFYGMTYAGGTVDFGTIFSLDLGLGPFVQTVPTSGRVGQQVLVLGNHLAGATSVTFNGAPAAFTVQSPTAIRTTVATGATTGPVQVVTPTGTLTSNVNFQVEP
jgi:uncharacterized repeat protein (TIGR03803 family)